MCLKSLFSKSSTPVQLRDFQTRKELNDWYNKNKGLSLPQGNHCDDHAIESQIMAEKDGFRLSLCLVQEGIVYFRQIYTNQDGSPNKDMNHIANLARVIEGETTSELWFVDLNWQKLVYITGFLPGGKYVWKPSNQNIT